ncbi:MAG: hypothetical protein ABIO16_14585, partial [Nocardioides sp.]
MRGTQWRVEDDDFTGREPDPVAAGGWVSLGFIRGTVRRLWFVWLASAVLGAGLATSWLVLVPPQSFGTVTMLLAHAPGTDPTTAMATDVKLLTTRSVAQRVIDQLGLETTPEDLLTGMQSDPPTSSVLQVQIKGTDPDDAVSRARVLASAYLDYRAQELSLQSQAVVDGYRRQISDLQAQVDDLTRQYDAQTARNG